MTSDTWLDGDLKLTEAEGNRAQAKLLEEMIELQFDHIAFFYDPDQEENGNEG